MICVDRRGIIGHLWPVVLIREAGYPDACCNPNRCQRKFNGLAVCICLEIKTVKNVRRHKNPQHASPNKTYLKGSKDYLLSKVLRAGFGIKLPLLSVFATQPRKRIEVVV